MMSNDTMRRAILAGPEQIDIEETPLGEPGPDEVLVKTRACAICTWEKRAYTGADTRFYPLLGGHEISGVVKAIGENDFQPRIGFKTRYGMVANPFVAVDGVGTNRANPYFRIFRVDDIMV